MSTIDEPRELGAVAQGEDGDLWVLDASGRWLNLDGGSSYISWELMRPARVVTTSRATALRDAADMFETQMAFAWGGDLSWLTNGTKVANLTAEILRSLADESEQR